MTDARPSQRVVHPMDRAAWAVFPYAMGVLVFQTSWFLLTPSLWNAEVGGMEVKTALAAQWIMALVLLAATRTWSK